MKTAESLLQAAKARLRQAKWHSECVVELIAKMNKDGINGKDVALMRSSAEEALQCVHEFNAYWNAYDTT